MALWDELRVGAGRPGPGAPPAGALGQQDLADLAAALPGPHLPQRLCPQPATQRPGGGVLSPHLGYPVPSPALFSQIGQRFRRAVAAYAEANDIPWVQFGKDDDKLAVMRVHLDRQAATGTSGVAAIGVAQEFQRVWAATQGKTATGTPRWSFSKADRRVTCSYLLPGGRRLWPRVHQGVRLVPVSGQGLAQRP